MSSSEVASKLQKAFPADQILLKGTKGYEERNNSYLSSLQCEVTPGVIFLPKSTEEVSAFVDIIIQSGGGLVTFAIRGAGQQPLPGCANIQDEVTLDLSLLKGVRINDDGSVSIGAGERWGTVYTELSREGLGVTGARSGNNGVGGLALSGACIHI